MTRSLPVVPRTAADGPDRIRPTRRGTPSVAIGNVLVGAAHPIVVQSMTNTDTADAAATAAQVVHLARAGSQIVRVTVNHEAAAAAIPELVRRVADEGVDVPIVGDFHYNGHKLLAAFPETAAALAKYRINPGNVGTKRRDENFQTIVKIAIDNGKPVRIGVNWGSLDQELLASMMDENSRRGEPWEALCAKLMLKWPSLYYMTSAFAPKRYPEAIIKFANSRGADKVMYAGYYPSGLSLERSFSELPGVPFRDHVWPKFLRENAQRVLKLGDRKALAATAA